MILNQSAPSTALGLAHEVRSVLAEHASAVDADAVFPTDSLGALRESGLLGLLVPAEYGGLGSDVDVLIEVAQVLASGCLSTAMIWTMHCQQVDALVRYATPRLRSELLPRIASGEVYLASVTTEPGKGGFLLSAEAPLEDAGETLSFERDAPVVTGGEYADGFLITLRAAPDAPTTRVSLVYADREQMELKTRGDWQPLGMRGTRSVHMRLCGAVPPYQVVGEPGEFRAVAVESMIVAGHLGWSACWLGAARSAMSDLVRLWRSPDGPAGRGAQSDLAAERLARVRVDLELVSAYLGRVRDEVLAQRAARRSLSDPACQIHLNVLKVAAAEITFRAVDRLVQISGLATGYMQDSPIPLERHLRDLRSASLNYSNDRLLTATGKLALLDRRVQLA